MRVEGIGLDTSTIASNKSVSAEKSSFADILRDALQQVETQENDAKMSGLDLITGNAQDVHQATIAYEKAYLTLMLTVEIRNKVVEAYQEIMRIQM
ncbi:MAG: flagellar hook-basal body complex protein FliE [Chitinophagales bacterium]